MEAAAAAAATGGTIPEQLALARLDDAVVQLQAASRHLEALQCMEKALVVRQRLYGLRSEEVWSAARVAGELCNLLALCYLQKEDYAMVMQLLSKAEALTERDLAGRAVTHNNWACLLRQQGKLIPALAHLRRALAIESRLTSVNNPADTRLNLCSVLSQLNKHDEALEHARGALTLMQDEVFGGSVASAASGPGGVMGAAAASKPDRCAALAVAYHAVGVEEEFARHFTAALQAYTKGLEMCKAFLGEEHALSTALRASQLGAAKAIEAERKARIAAEAAAAEAAARAAMEKVAGGREGGEG